MEYKLYFLPGCEYSSTDARLLLTRQGHCVWILSARASGEVMMVLMPCRAADTVTGTELSEVLTAVSLSTPVIRKSTVGKIVMLPVKAQKYEKIISKRAAHCYVNNIHKLSLTHKYICRFIKFKLTSESKAQIINSRIRPLLSIIYH